MEHNFKFYLIPLLKREFLSTQINKEFKVPIANKSPMLQLTVLVFVFMLNSCCFHHSYSRNVGVSMGDTIGIAFVELARELSKEDEVPIFTENLDVNPTKYFRVHVSQYVKDSLFTFFPKGYHLVEIPEANVSLTFTYEDSKKKPSMNAIIDLSNMYRVYGVDVVFIVVLDPELAATQKTRDDGLVERWFNLDYLPLYHVVGNTHAPPPKGDCGIYTMYAIRCTIFGWNVLDTKKFFRDVHQAYSLTFFKFGSEEEIDDHFQRIAKSISGSIVGRFKSSY